MLMCQGLQRLAKEAAFLEKGNTQSVKLVQHIPWTVLFLSSFSPFERRSQWGIQNCESRRQEECTRKGADMEAGDLQPHTQGKLTTPRPDAKKSFCPLGNQKGSGDKVGRGRTSRAPVYTSNSVSTKVERQQRSRQHHLV
mmetsp:Transcript_31866/g.73207  ORF Transcript_31866/g.73207 Transcript_31866/m.73207 type:complete len:140 (-) Transcript_31866:263-682(-)